MPLGFAGLRDRRAAARVAARIARLANGLFGDCKPLRGGVSELRVDEGPGYRLYYARAGRTVILLLCGGTKRTQAADMIARSHIGMTGRRERQMKKAPASRPHDEWLHEQLREPAFAAEYISAAAEDDPVVYLSALRHVAESHGMAKIAQAAGIPRESLYRALSPRGNPRLSTLTAIMKAAGMKLSAAAHEQPKKTARRRKTTARA